jgi:CheY-like chemotaxis protein
MIVATEQPVRVTGAETGFGKRRVRLFDDAPVGMQAVHGTLKNTYIIKIATSGAKALALSKVLPQPDLILRDIMMREMDSHEVCTVFIQRRRRGAR